MKNPEKPILTTEDEGYFYLSKDGCKLFISDYQAIDEYKASIFIISGITGINHFAEKDLIEQLSNNKYKVVVIHPRGTGYSDGKRGDSENFLNLIDDYVEIIKSDKNYLSKDNKLILFGHSMSTAVLLAVADKIGKLSGAILVNPPYKLKKAKGMSPNFSQYLQYVWYYLFNRHKAIVNMAGNPELIENEEDKKESENRINDPLLVKYFSLYMMNESRKLMNSMLTYPKTANYPLLLLYGLKDNIVEKQGCDLIFKYWKCENKVYKLIDNGSHGKSTVILSKDIINKWIADI